MEKVMLTFENGIKIEADVNGDCYIVDEKPDFPIGLTTVLVDDGEVEIEKENVTITESAPLDGRYWFALVPASEFDIWRAEIEDALCELSMGE